MPLMEELAEWGLTPYDLEVLLEAAKIAAAKAASLIRECIDKRATMPLEIDEKAYSVDLVTQYDRKCETIVLDTLKEECDLFNMRRRREGVQRADSVVGGSAGSKANKDGTVPFRVLSEESRSDEPLLDAPTWVVDPIDGTTSFVHGSFDCGVSIGLAINKKPVMGVVNLPIMKEVFWGIRGKGSFCNGQPCRVSGCKDVQKALVCIHTSYNRSDAAIDAIMGVTKEFAQRRCHGIRGYGSAAMDMCSVACGRLDLYFETGIQAWDTCAAAIIVREAGGIVAPIYKKGDLTPEQSEQDFDLMNKAMVCSASPQLAALAQEVSEKYKYREAVLFSKNGESKL
jgi:myo-inositol-1(or 4)-monophosphatase